MSNQTINSSQPQRMLWVDQMRAFAIITVVISHIFSFCIGGGNLSVISNYFISFYMPLFFFISGFVGYKKEYRQSFTMEVVTKARQLLLPTLVFFCLFEWLIADNWMEDLCHQSKGGYWFLIGLFYISCLYSAIRRLFIRYKIGDKFEDLLMIVVGSILVCLPVVYGIALHNGNNDPLSITKLSFFVFFALGAIVRKHYVSCLPFFSKSWVTCCIILVSFLGYAVFEKYDLCHGYVGLISTPVLSMACVLLSMEFFKRHEDDVNHAIPHLKNIGTRTLDIYVIHWLLLPYGMDSIGGYFATIDAHILYFLTGVLMATVVVAAAYLIGSIIRLSPLLARWTLGLK